MKKIVRYTGFGTLLFILFSLFFYLIEAHAADYTGLFCLQKATAEALVGAFIKGGSDAAADATANAMDNGACFMSNAHVDVFLVYQGPVTVGQYMVVRVVGLSPTADGNVTLWGIQIVHFAEDSKKA